MTEQAGLRDLVRHAAATERAGFDFETIGDHYFPWLAEQGHSPKAWIVLGAIVQVTEQVELMTCVTGPTMRNHPVVVAQHAETTQLLSGNRFTLGLGAGEYLNEHVVGRDWPPVNVRHCGDLGGGSGCRWRQRCPGAASARRAHEQVHWFGGDWKVNAELPGPKGFAAAARFVSEADAADAIPCGSDVDAIVAAAKPFRDAGFTDLTLVQVGGDDQEAFLAAARDRLLPAFREAAAGKSTREAAGL